MASTATTTAKFLSQSIFIAKNLATKSLNLSSTIQIPTQVTEPNAVILYCALESKHVSSTKEFLEFVPVTTESITGENQTCKNAWHPKFLNKVYNMPILHDFIEKNGENSEKLSEEMRKFYLDWVKFMNVKPVILSPEEKARQEKIQKMWNSGVVFESTPFQVGKSKNLKLVDDKDSKKENIMITSALPYVNNVPHLGNIIGCVLSADTFARYQRNIDNNVLYVCGTDEYGTATETKALAEGLTCQQICDKYHKIHREVYEWFQCSFDYFGRTTTEKQTEIAQQIFLDLHEQGKLIEKEVDQLYDEKEQMFLADRFVTGTCPLCGFDDARGDQCDGCGKLLNATELINPISAVSKTKPVLRTSKHQFIRLDAISDDLNTWLNKELFQGKCTSKNTISIANQWVKKGLEHRCITRDLKWGTKVPMKGYEDKVFYVWFDAPIGYVSITANYIENWKDWWFNPDKVDYYQFMAKDNVPFHSIVFPSCQIGTGKNWTKVKHLNATEYLQYESGKFSKSRGVGVFGNHAKETGIVSDYWRFYLLFVRPEEKDTEFNWNDFQSKINDDLLKNFGNYCNRPLSLANKFYAGKLPAFRENLQDRDQQFISDVDSLLQEYHNLFSNSQIRPALRTVLKISALGNQYLQELQPWKLKKTDEVRAGQIVSLAIQLVALLAVLIEPFMPMISNTIFGQLGLSTEKRVLLPEVFGPMLEEGHQLGKASPLITQISDDLIKECREKYKGKQ